MLWYDALFQINFVSKELQDETVDLSIAMNSFKTLMIWLKKLSIDKSVQTLLTAKKLTEDMEVVAIFLVKRLKKRQYDESGKDFTLGNAEDNYRINCFNKIADTAIQSLQPRFEELKSNYNLFGFLVSFKSFQPDDIQKFAETLEQALTSSINQSADICGRELIFYQILPKLR